MNPLLSVSFSDLLQGDPIPISDFENEVSKLILMVDSPFDDQTQKDVQAIIADALKRRCCNPKTVIQMHMRMKKGMNPNAALNQLELNDLSDLFLSSNKNKNSKIAEVSNRLANFYVRLANMRAVILQQQRLPQQPQQPPFAFVGNNDLMAAYSKTKEAMHAKQSENQEHFARILRTIIADPHSEKRSIHPDVTDADMVTLEMQLHDLVESGCATYELRCLKIMEAAIEQQKYDALIAELNALE
jgi:hypothetical protein